MSSRTESQSAIRRALPWLVIYTVLWAILSANSDWLLGSFFIVLATAVTAYQKLPFHRLGLRHLPAFFAWFLKQSLLGAWDVAVRTFSVPARIQPGWVVYPVSLQDLHVRLLFSAIPGLLPGTLAVRIENDEMHLHLLDTGQDWQTSVRELEQHLVALFSAVENSEAAAEDVEDKA